MHPDDMVQNIKGVGEVLAAKLHKLGIETVADVLAYFPRKYDTYSDIVPISQMKPGLVSLRVTLNNVSTKRVKRGLHVTHADAVDSSGKVSVIWFNQPYRAASLTNDEYVLQGEFALKNQRLQIVNPSVERVKDIPKNSPIIPTYSERLGLKSNQFRKIINQTLIAVKDIPETLPTEILKKYDLLPIADAYYYIHQPITTDQLVQAKRRFAFEELFVVMLASMQIKQQGRKLHALEVPFTAAVAQDFVKQLPFTLTDAQKKVAWQIFKDLEHLVPMNRLVEGDVGSGKTVVAAMAAIMTLEAHMQVAVIAPTEILARQHYATLKKLLAHTRHATDIELLVGSLKKSEKTTIKEQISSHKSTCIVGTHAVLEEDINWSSLGLVIIDEQHRFGVSQRQRLHTKAGHMPHVLCMTATPIPRSLALTVYGELDISIINQMPSNRTITSTSIVSPNSVAQMYAAVSDQLLKGRQAYIVCPLITESETLMVANAEQTFIEVSKTYLKQFRVGLIHGRLKAADKEATMQAFKNHELDVLVATTVIEVGVDVPNATDMVILGADRFGLAQLHQLRGRIGRGEHQGHCYLVMSDSKAPSKRMRAIESTTNGFELAEYDLELRGPGAIYGVRQHGELDLRHVTLSDHQLIAQVRDAATEFMKGGESVVHYPRLAAKINKTLQLTYLN